MGTESARTVSTRILTVPNLLSFVRLALVPVFLVLLLVGNDLAALVVLVVSVITDYLDGVIARTFGQISRLGQVLDPAADRLFILATLLGLAARGIIPWWFVAVLVARDVMLLGVGVVLAANGYGPLPVHHLGKVATFVLFYALPTLVLGQAVPSIAWLSDPVGWALALWGAFLYWWAGVIYLIQTVRLIRIPRVAEPTPSDTLDS